MNILPVTLVETLIERLPDLTPEHRLLGRVWSRVLRDRMIYRRPMSREETPLQHWLAPTNGGRRVVVVWVSFPTFTGFPNPTPNLRVLICPRTLITNNQLNQLTTLEKLVIDQCPNITRVDGLTQLCCLRATGTALDWRVPLPTNLHHLKASFLGVNGVLISDWLRSSSVRTLTMDGDLSNYSSTIDFTTLPLITLHLMFTGPLNVIRVGVPETIVRLSIDWPRALYIQSVANLVSLRDLTLHGCHLREAPIDWQRLLNLSLDRVNMFGYPHEKLAYRQARVYSNTGATDSDAIAGKYLNRVVSLTLRDVAWVHLVAAIPTMVDLQHLTLIRPLMIQTLPDLRLQLESLTVIDPHGRTIDGLISAIDSVRSLTITNAIVNFQDHTLSSTCELSLTQCTVHKLHLPSSLQRLSLNRLRSETTLTLPAKLESLAIHDCTNCSIDMSRLVELDEFSLAGGRLQPLPWLTNLRSLSVIRHRLTVTFQWELFTRLTRLRVDDTVTIDYVNNPPPKTLVELVAPPTVDRSTILSLLPRLERYNEWVAATVDDSCE